MQLKLIQIATIIWTLACASIIVWIYATEPRWLPRHRGKKFERLEVPRFPQQVETAERVMREDRDALKKLAEKSSWLIISLSLW